MAQVLSSAWYLHTVRYSPPIPRCLHGWQQQCGARHLERAFKSQSMPCCTEYRAVTTRMQPRIPLTWMPATCGWEQGEMEKSIAMLVSPVDVGSGCREQLYKVVIAPVNEESSHGQIGADIRPYRPHTTQLCFLYPTDRTSAMLCRCEGTSEEAKSGGETS